MKAFPVLTSGSKRLTACGIVSGALLFFAGAAFAQAPRVVAVYPPNGATRVAANVVITVAFDRPTAKHSSSSLADFTAGGGLVTRDADRWSPAGDTLYIIPSAPLEFGHLYGMKLNLVQGGDSVFYNDTFYPQIYYFTTASQASVVRVQAGDVGLSLTPDVTLPVPIPVRELAGTDVAFTSVRVQFLPSSTVANVDTTSLDLSVTPFYEYTLPVGILLRRFGAASLVAPVTLPEAIARTIPQGLLGVRLTFYGTDETSSPIVVDAVFRVDPASVAVHQASVLPAMATDVLVQSATLEWPLHGAVIAAGDTILPRAVVTGNGTGPFRAAFYMDGDLIAIEEGYMEGGRPAEVTMRGPLPTRRLGEHRLQFQVEAPQPVSANPISFVCAPPAHGIEPRARNAPPPTPPPGPAAASRLHGSTTWLAEGRSGFRGQDPSAVGWGAWNGAYDLGPTRRIETEVSMRLRFDETGNGHGTPQHMKVRYSDTRASLEWSDAPPQGAAETPLFMSPVPRRSAQAGLRGTPLGDLDGYMALASHPISSGGPIRDPESDLYAARLKRSWLKEKIRTTLYAGYTHEDATPGGVETMTHTRAIYGGMGLIHLPGTWTALADLATVRHRKIEGVEDGRSRTAWRSEVRGGALGFEALAQAFSYQPALATALNPYALSDRRGGYAELKRAVFNWRFFGSFRSEEPSARDGLIPVVRVQTSSFGGRLALNQESWVTPSIIRVTHRGANTDFTESRIATDYSVAEPLGGRTSARFDVTFIDDALRAATKRRVTSGSFVTTRRHPGRVVSTLSLGFEQNHSSDLHLTDTTIQGSFEARWEAIASRLLVIPFFAGSTRNYELEGTHEDRYSVRLQLALLRVAGLGENAVSLEGRVDRVQHLTPASPTNLDGAVQITIGRRFSVGALQ